MPDVKSLVPFCLLVCVLIPFVLLSAVFPHFLFVSVLYPYFVFECLRCYAPASSIAAFAGGIGRGNAGEVEFKIWFYSLAHFAAVFLFCLIFVDFLYLW